MIMYLFIKFVEIFVNCLLREFSVVVMKAMLTMRFECTICRESCRGLPARKCCGQLYCALCLYKTRGFCMVCEKDTLNSENTCTVCNKIENFFSIQECMNSNCTAQVCGACNNVSLNGPMIFCSTRCNFEAFLEMKPINDMIDKIVSNK